MNRLNYIIKYLFPAAFALAVVLTSCVSEDLGTDSPSVPEDPQQGVTHKPNRFIAFKINIAGDITTRGENGEKPPHDADYPDASSSNYVEGTYFNKGLPFERALYFPKDQNNDLPEISEPEIENVSKNEIEENDENSLDYEYNQFYHFIILFNEDGTPKTELLKLNLEPGSDKEDDDVTVYAQFFDSTDEDENPFINFAGSALVVLNASYDLQLQVASELGDYDTSDQALNKISTFLPSKTPTAPDYFLFLRDHKGEYILDENGNRYFTMSSSMVIKDGKVVAATSTTPNHSPFQFYNSLEKAKNNPTSLYVERLQSKFTVVFEGNNKICVGSDNSLKEVFDKNYYYLTSADLSNINVDDGSGFKPTNRLMYYPNGTTYDVSEPNYIKYVSSYTRSDAIGDRKPVNVITTKKWKVNIIGWGVNGLESEEYLFKQIKDGADYTSASWFTSPNISYRNFWAEDPHYDSSLDYYPHQFRQAYSFLYDKDYSVNPSDESKNTLDYFDFSSLSRRNVRQYIPENTFSKDLILTSYEDLNHLRVGSHLILTAQLLIKGEYDDFEYPGVYDSENFDDQGLIYRSMSRVRTKYLMNDIFWEETAYMNYFIEYMGYWMHQDFVKQNQSDAEPNDGIFYVNKYGAKAEWGSFKIENFEIKGGDAMVWVRPKEGVTLYAFNPEAKVGEDPYKEITLDTYKSLVFQHKNYLAKRFDEGRMYYATGSLHVPTASVLSHPETGDFGTVRNNWYYYTIEDITKPGTAVAEPSQLIIPNNEPYETGLGVSLRLLEWHREFIDADLSDQR